jgi:hypothetical protein
VTSFRFDIGGRARKAGRFIGRVRSELLKAAAEEKDANGVTAGELAKKLKTRNSAINKQLEGESNLSLRALADLAWALNREISFELRPLNGAAGQNIPAETSTVRGQMKVIGGPAEDSSTLPSPPQTHVVTSKTVKFD